MDSREGGQPPEELHTVHLVLRDGFRGHTVAITLNDRLVYDAVDVTTDPLTARAGALAVRATGGVARLGVSVTPGGLSAAVDVNVAAHPYIAISVVGEGTVAFETSAAPFRALDDV
jgi:hypothetical protein